MRAKGRMTSFEAAAKAFVSEETIRLWAREKRVEAVKYAKQWWVSADSLDEVMAVLR